MRALRFLFLTVHAASQPHDGLPIEEMQTFANAWLIPASFVLRDRFLPEPALSGLLDTPNRSLAAEVAVGLWSSQQRMCEHLLLLGVDIRGMPPVNGRALEAFFLPKGRFWMGAYCPNPSLAASQDSISKALTLLFGHPPRKSRSIPFPWLTEFSRSSAWALGANQAFGDHVDLLGSPL